MYVAVPGATGAHFFAGRKLLLRCLLPLLLLIAAEGNASADSKCQDLLQTRADGLSVESAFRISDHKELRSFCEVRGRIDERIQYVLRMPASGWNGKFAVAGCGGFCGALIPDKPGYSNSINEAVKLGYAAIQTDSGHEDDSWSTDWALADPPALPLYAGAWLPRAVAIGHTLVEAYYLDPVRRTYFSGCSNGGRLAMMAAQRYPDLFDGIAGGGGIFDLTGQAGVHGLWLLQSTRDKQGRSLIDQAKLPLLQEAVMGQCDALDGVEDGVVSRPELCAPQIDQLQCADASSSVSCFSAMEINSIKRLYQGATVDGVQLYPGIPPGSESLWAIWVVGTDDEPAWGERAAEGNLRLTYGLRADEAFNPHDYVLAEELDNLQRLAPVLNATSTDLTAFEKSGGKFFYYHGLADPLILEGRVRSYHAELTQRMGPERVSKFARLFMVPGHGHCWEKPGQVADEFDPLTVIDHWVESGDAPESIITAQRGQQATPLRTAKLCPHPMVAKFSGGDSSRAQNFECVKPE